MCIGVHSDPVMKGSVISLYDAGECDQLRLEAHGIPESAEEEITGASQSTVNVPPTGDQRGEVIAEGRMTGEHSFPAEYRSAA